MRIISLTLVVLIGLLNNGFSQKMNPKIGVNGLFGFQNSGDEHLQENDGFSLQEVEIQFAADVDPYFSSQVAIGIHQHSEGSHGEEDEDHGEHEEQEHGFSIDVEEACLDTIALSGFVLRLGKFYSSFGKLNHNHTHALPFIRRSEFIQSNLGLEGYRDTGLRISANIPVKWFSELNFEALAGSEEVIGEESAHDVSGIIKLTNLWDLSSSTTFELGNSFLSYSNDEAYRQLLGADITLKWRPTKFSQKTSLELMGEEISNKTLNSEVNSFLTALKYQFKKCWVTQYRYQDLGFNLDESLKVHSFLVGFIPSEFSALRVQYDLHSEEGETFHTVALQANFSIGAYPAHQY